MTNLIRAACLAMLMFAANATFAAYPERPLRYILGSAAGGGPDVAARVIMTELGRQTGQQVIVDNRPGASGILGTDLIVRATPDGYTMGHGNINTMAINPSVMPNIPYDHQRDLQAVVLMYNSPNLLAVTVSLPVKSVQELIDYAKKNPDKLIFASTGNGSSVHIGMELFKLMTDTRMVHVPYKAATVAITDLTAGRVQLMADNIQSIGSHVKAGRLRGLAVTSGRRVPAFSELPTIAESGVPGFDVSAWAGIVVPAGVPKNIVNALNAIVNQALKAAVVQEKLPEFGLQIVGSTPEQYAAHIKSETTKWADVVKRSGAKAD
jgi:tripartite-type tricarboxylate transporter receptor subunit TctC